MFKVAVIPGDGIGKEVMREGIRVLDAAGERCGFEIDWQSDYASCGSSSTSSSEGSACSGMKKGTSPSSTSRIAIAAGFLESVLTSDGAPCMS